MEDQVGESAQLGTVGRGTPTSSEITSIGTLPAKSEMKSNEPDSSAGSRCWSVISRMRTSMAFTLEGVKPLPTSDRMRVCFGGSRARKDIVRCASGPKALGSSETPYELEYASTLRKAASTSSWRDSAQKSNCSER